MRNQQDVQILAERIRRALARIDHVTEQEKMGGVSFHMNGNMCIRAHSGDEILVRCTREQTETLLQELGARRFQMRGKSNMKGWLVVGPEGIDDQKRFSFWVKVALDHTQTLSAKKKR
jgi:hypothetical protein